MPALFHPLTTGDLNLLVRRRKPNLYTEFSGEYKGAPCVGESLYVSPLYDPLSSKGQFNWLVSNSLYLNIYTSGVTYSFIFYRG